MKYALIAAMCLPLLARAGVSPTASALTPSAKAKGKVLVLPNAAHAFMLGDRLLVTGSSPALSSEFEARTFAVKDAAKTAAEFLEKQGYGGTMDLSQDLEKAVLLETPLASKEVNDVKVEDLRQERWSSEGGQDHYSIYLVMSVRVGKKHKAEK